MRLYGFNFLINGHYNFTYGYRNHLEGLLEAVQENGFLMSFSLPHLNAFDWKLHERETRDRYEKTTRFVIRKVANNPAVVMYAMNHNATGTMETKSTEDRRKVQIRTGGHRLEQPGTPTRI